VQKEFPVLYRSQQVRVGVGLVGSPRARRRGAAIVEFAFVAPPCSCSSSA
jgi:hypothetical protein